MANRGDFRLERREGRHDRRQDWKGAPGANDPGTRLLDGLHEVGERAELGRIERHAGRREQRQRFGDRLAGAEREEGMAFEERDGLRGRVDRIDDGLRIGGRLESLQRVAPKRSQGEAANRLDDAIEFEGF